MRWRVTSKTVLAALGVSIVLAVVSCSSSTLDVDGGTLVYVPFGNSATFTPDTQSGFIYQYRERLQAEFGVDVDLRNRTVANDSSAALLERMRTNERFRQDLAEADVVTMLVPFDGWAVPWQTVAGVGGYDPADCGGDDGQQCLRDILTEYEANTEAIFAELMSLVDPSETLVRGMDAYLVHVGDFADGGKLDEVAPYWVEAQQFVRDVAASHGIPVARLLDAFNGPDGTDDPMASGLVSSDAIHPTAEGATLITKLVSDLGYRLSD